MRKTINSTGGGTAVVSRVPAASHFGLGVDALVTSGELRELRSDLAGTIPAQRAGSTMWWARPGSERFSGWAARLEVPGI